MNKDSIPVEYILPSWGNGAPELSLSLAGKWEQQLKKGPDFDVHWFVSKSLGGSLGIYVGHHPQPVAATAETTKTTFYINNQDVAFTMTSTKDGQKAGAIINDFFKEFPGPGVAQLKLHVMINASKQDFLDAAGQALKSLKPRSAPC